MICGSSQAQTEAGRRAPAAAQDGAAGVDRVAVAAAKAASAQVCERDCSPEPSSISLTRSSAGVHALRSARREADRARASGCSHGCFFGGMQPWVLLRGRMRPWVLLGGRMLGGFGCGCSHGRQFARHAA